MNKILNNKFLYPVLILLVVFFIGLTNYKFGTYLTGWDNLQTELSPLLGVKRALFSSWQEYQSFGLVSGMAHASDLVRAVFVWILSLVIPTSFIRYFFHLLMLYLGGVGIFMLLRYLGFSGRKEVLSFFGALFYILNLGTIQIFSLPFEPFSIFFAFLPFGILSFLKFIYHPKLEYKTILFYLLIHFIATPLAYLQTLFVVYFLCLIFMSFGILLENKDLRSVLIKRILLAVVLILIVNLFWIIPQLYFVKSSLNIVGQSKINQLATTIVSKQNMEKGTISNFARMEGFYYDLSDTDGNPIFEAWHKHFNNFFTNLVSYLPFILLLVGFFTKRKNHYGFISIFILISMMLLSNTAVLSYFNSIIFSHDFINQVFRSPFTKFIIPFSLSFTYLFVCGIDFVFELYTKLSKQKNFIESVIAHFIIILIIAIHSLPVFSGYFFSPLMRVEIPKSYFDVISYFKEVDKNKRIALLPDYTFWGWYSTKWGYDGSGFMWYGINQPIVSRTFDVWSRVGESYFWEIKYAIETANPKLFNKVVQKYRIDYFILDKTLEPVSSVEDGLQYDQIDKIFTNNTNYEKVFSNNELDIYKVNHNSRADNFIQIAKNIKDVGPLTEITNLDLAFYDVGFYKDGKNYDYYYPFSDLITQTNLKKKNWDIKEEGEYIVLTANSNQINPDEYDMVYDPNTLSEANVFLGEDIKKYNYEVYHSIVGNNLILKFKKILVQNFDPTYVDVNNCRSTGSFDVVKRGGSLMLNSKNRGMACFGYESPLLAHWNGYVVKVDSENIKGNSLFFYIFGNKLRKQSKLETDLSEGQQYFVVNPGYYLDDGYFFSFQNPSYQNMETQNILKSLEIYLFPFDFLKSVKFVKKDMLNRGIDSQALTYFDAKKINIYTYIVKNPKEKNSNIVLYQAFDNGWNAYGVKNNSFVSKSAPFLVGKLIKDHFIVNSWANGWDISQQDSDYIVLFYWPQMLEYGGLLALLLFIPIAYFIARKLIL